MILDLEPIRVRRDTRRKQVLALLEVGPGLDSPGRAAAVEAARSFCDDPDVRRRLRERLTTEPERSVRAAALSVLRAGDVEADGEPLASALLALAAHAEDRPMVLPLLERLAGRVSGVAERLLPLYGSETSARGRADLLRVLLALANPSSEVLEFLQRIAPSLEEGVKFDVFQALARFRAMPRELARQGMGPGEPGPIRRLCLRHMDAVGEGTPGEYLGLFASEKDLRFRRLLLASIAARFLDHQDAVEAVINSALSDQDPALRRDALRVLGSRGASPAVRDRLVARLGTEREEANLLFLIERLAPHVGARNVREGLAALAEETATILARVSAVRALSPLLPHDPGLAARFVEGMDRAPDDRLLKALSDALTEAPLPPGLRLDVARRLGGAARAMVREQALKHFLRVPLRVREFPGLLDALPLLNDTALSGADRTRLAEGLFRWNGWTPEQLGKLRRIGLTADLDAIRVACRAAVDRAGLAAPTPAGPSPVADWLRQIAEGRVDGIFPRVFWEHTRDPEGAERVLLAVLTDRRLDGVRYQAGVELETILAFLATVGRVSDEVTRFCLNTILTPFPNHEGLEHDVYLGAARQNVGSRELRPGVEAILQSPPALRRLRPALVWEVWLEICRNDSRMAAGGVEGGIAAARTPEALESYFDLAKAVLDPPARLSLFQALARRSDLLEERKRRDLRTLMWLSGGDVSEPPAARKALADD